MLLVNYLKQLSFGRLLLWLYLVWYLAISIVYFDADLELWLTALGISLIVGSALVLSTNHWPTMRLFLIPFCVSSYSMLIKDKGCVVIFPPDLETNSIALLAIAGFLLIIVLVKQLGTIKQRTG